MRGKRRLPFSDGKYTQRIAWCIHREPISPYIATQCIHREQLSVKQPLSEYIGNHLVHREPLCVYISTQCIHREQLSVNTENRSVYTQRIAQCIHKELLSVCTATQCIHIENHSVTAHLMMFYIFVHKTDTVFQCLPLKFVWQPRILHVLSSSSSECPALHVLHEPTIYKFSLD